MSADKVFKLSVVDIVLSSFASPSTSPANLGFDSNGCIWLVDWTTNLVYKLNTSGTVLSSFAAPSVAGMVNAHGLALDASNCIWVSEGPEL